MNLIRLCLLLCVFLFVTACGATPAPTTTARATALSLPTSVNLPTADAQAVETAITIRVLATLTASAQQSNGQVPAAASTVTPPPQPQNSAPTVPPPTLSAQLSPSVTPVPLRPTDIPRAVTAAPTSVPTQAPPEITHEGLAGKIIFKSARDDGKYPNKFNYYVMDADGQNQYRLERKEAEAFYEQLLPLEGYSPDRQILVLGESRCNSARCDLYIGPPEVIEARSQGVWTPKGVFAATDPIWSPDGSNIAFVWTRDNERTKNIFRAPPESNPQFVRLTNFGGKRDTKHPSYSPDSAQIAFATQDGELWQIWVLDAYADRDCSEEDCASNPRPLAASGFDDWDPLWVK